MIARPVVPTRRHKTGFIALAGVALAPVFLACGGSTVTSGVAVGKFGQGLSASAQTVPQGTAVCVLQDALTPSASEKPAGETCEKAIKSDRLWRGSMSVLAAHADRIGASPWVLIGSIEQAPARRVRIELEVIVGEGIFSEAFMEDAFGAL